MSRRPSAAQAKRFQKDLDFFTKDVLPQEVLKFTKAIAFHILRGVTMKTPVGNPRNWKNPRAPKGYVGGHARMNWQVSMQAPVMGVVQGTDPHGVSALISGMSVMGMAMPYEKIWIVNNVPYITVLENGRGPDERGIMRGSVQAPHGMLGVTMEEVRRDFRAR